MASLLSYFNQYLLAAEVFFTSFKFLFGIISSQRPPNQTNESEYILHFIN